VHHKIVLGKDISGADLTLRPHGANILITGTSGSGKSTLATSMLESLAALKYQFLIIDPEGDYSSFEQAVVLGDHQRPPSLAEVLDVLGKVEQSAAVNLVGLGVNERPKFFEQLLPRIQELRARTGRPHWMVIDEAHHVLPSSWETAGMTLARDIASTMLITLEANRVSPSILSTVDVVVAVGDEPDAMFRIFAHTVGQPPPPLTRALKQGEALAWSWRTAAAPVWFEVAPPRFERRRHRRKYAEGELPPELSFYFRGSDGRLNLRAQNLTMFLQMADGVDDETWLYHLHEGDLSTWFRNVIKDPDLAAEAEAVEDSEGIDAEQSRRRIRDRIEQRYVLL